MKNLRAYLWGLCFISLFNTQVDAQAGMATSPARVYYHLLPGSSGIQRVRVSNTGNQPLEVGVSVSDWDYDSTGNNRIYDAGTLKTSCAKWLQVLPGTFFTIPPKESQELTVNLTVPGNADSSVPVHTAMLFFTQLNPLGAGKNTKGAVIKEVMRMGVKVYQNSGKENLRDIEINNFQDREKPDTQKKMVRYLELGFTNTGKTWLEGKIQWELLDLATGKKIKMEDQHFYSLPGDHRIISQHLPPELKKGKYSVSAIIN